MVDLDYVGISIKVSQIEIMQTLKIFRRWQAE